MVFKFNRFNMKQERTLLLTSYGLYNLKKDSIQRKIPLTAVKALTKSTLNGCMQFVVHVKHEYDYMFDSEFRKIFVDAVKWAFHQ
jgi:hypothetical protein